MKSAGSIILVVVLLIAVFLVMGAAKPKDDGDDSIAQLKARVSSLERRVAGLERKLRTSTPRRGSVPARPSKPQLDRTLPRNRLKREFNGVPYYIVPLEQKQRD